MPLHHKIWQPAPVVGVGVADEDMAHPIWFVARMQEIAGGAVAAVEQDALIP